MSPFRSALAILASVATLSCKGTTAGAPYSPSPDSARGIALAITVPGSIIAATCAPDPMYIQAIDGAGAPAIATSAIAFQLSSTVSNPGQGNGGDSGAGGTVAFYADATCSQRVSSGMIAAGESSSTPIYVSRNVATSPTAVVAITAIAENVTATASLIVTTNAAFNTAWDEPDWDTHVNSPSSKTGVLNVRNYGAAGDGITDDTAAIMATISAASLRGTTSADARDSIVYFPSGTYLISSALVWKDSTGAFVSELAFQGQNKTDTIIRYVDGTSGIQQDPNCVSRYERAPTGSPNAVVYTASTAGKTNGQGLADGTGNDAFRNHIQNLTIDIGRNNPDLIGIDYAGSNQTKVIDVNIISDDGQGCVGFSDYRYSEGPDYFGSLFVEGFSYGIWQGGGAIGGSSTADPNFSNYEHVVLQDQRVAAVQLVSASQATMRDIVSDQSASGVAGMLVNNLQGQYSTVVTLVDATFTGNDSRPAVVLDTTGTLVPSVFVRNSRAVGYGGMIAVPGEGTVPSPIGEWSSYAALRGSGSSGNGSLDLIVRDMPRFPDDSGGAHSSWVFPLPPSGVGCPAVTNHSTTCDWQPSIQAAIDGAPASSTVVIPWGWYGLGKPLVLGTATHGKNVKRLLCLGCHLVALATNNGGQALIVGDNNDGTVWIDGLVTSYAVGNPGTDPVHFGSSSTPFPSASFTPVIENVANNTVVVLRAMDNITYLDRPSDPNATPADVFLESVAYGPFIFVNQKAWARNLDPEVAPASQAFFTCNTGGSDKRNEPTDFLQQGYSHVVVANKTGQTGAQLWTLGLKTENREWPTPKGPCNFSWKQGDQGNDGSNLPANSLLEIDNGAVSEVLGLTAADHRLNAIDITGSNIGAVSTNALSNDVIGPADAQLSIEGYFAWSSKSSEYAFPVIQTYANRPASAVHQSQAVGCGAGIVCAYPNGEQSAAPGSTMPLYIGH